jgi:hypothetical protein
MKIAMILLCLGYCGILAYLLSKKQKRKETAEYAMEIAKENLARWQKEHPYLHVGAHPIGRRCVEEAIATYNEYFRLHPQIPIDKEHLHKLQNLLNEE